MNIDSPVSPCRFCGRPAEYQCDHVEVTRLEKLPSVTNRWTKSCFVATCFVHCVELDDNYHLCLEHRPAPSEAAVVVMHRQTKPRHRQHREALNGPLTQERHRSYS